MIDKTVLGSECPHQEHVFADGIPFAMRRTDVGGDNMLPGKGDQLAIKNGKDCTDRNGRHGKQPLSVDSALTDSCVGNIVNDVDFVVHENSP